MIDPSKLSYGQRIELKQNQKGEWQEWLFDRDNNIVAVETVKLFEESKKIQPSKELKGDYYSELLNKLDNLEKITVSKPPVVEKLPDEFIINLEPPEVDNNCDVVEDDILKLEENDDINYREPTPEDEPDEEEKEKEPDQEKED